MSAKRRKKKKPVRRRIRRARKRSSSRNAPPRGWAKWPKEKLLDARIGKLGLRINGSELKPRVRQLYRELSQRGFKYFRPHCWLSDEWFSPDGTPGIAIPFFLAHPRLKRLENEYMLQVEGGTHDYCMKLLRHEAGHALLNAYQLNRRRDWQQVFGKSSAKYPDTYLPRPYSKSFVTHLENWYAQSHPHEDWAETFAVWLKPGSDWRKRYEDWPALKKLQYVDTLMQEIRGTWPKLRNRREETPLRSLTLTLREYYADKQKRYIIDKPEFLDRDLKRLFSDSPEHKKNERASQYIRRVRAELITLVSRWTSEYDYRISQVLKDMVQRCDELKLRVARADEHMKTDLVACVTVLVMNKLHSGGFHIRL